MDACDDYDTNEYHDKSIFRTREDTSRISVFDCYRLTVLYKYNVHENVIEKKLMFLPSQDEVPNTS
jgi:hypothetical protein